MFNKSMNLCLSFLVAIVSVLSLNGIADSAVVHKPHTKITLKAGDKIYDITQNVECGYVASMQYNSAYGQYVFTVAGRPASKYSSNLYNPCGARKGDKFGLSNREKVGVVGTALEVGPYWFGQPVVYIGINEAVVNGTVIATNPQTLAG